MGIRGNNLDENLQMIINDFEEEVNYLKQENEKKENFTLNITHDMRSHLNVIISALQFIEHNDWNIRDEKRYMNIIKRNSYKILKLINNLIDTSRLENNYYKLEKRNMDIVSMIEGTVECIERYSLEKNIQLIFDTNKEECIVSADPEAIDRIVMNLLSNAIKFSPMDSEIFVYLNIDSENINISVKDKGKGISKEEQDKIFNRFYQCSNRSAKEYIGSGIGLDLTNYLVKAHGGNISINSRENEGAEFIVTIPRILEEHIEGIDNSISSKIQMLEIEFSDIYLSE
ncbi:MULTISPECIES: sensor histidine kinase [Clostridium]|jgi:signal transduction histidine kinase|uniref:histidine kinase n=2 Tax=Clostridium TaxID=1485 RepID=A0A174ESH6_9CLOT|nr:MULTISPECIES: HAMP domain-containing sensor histidine kinase [Clostridium]MCD2503010.1 HAMP domain-containing histidine kinase [Clostridium sp. NSJ-145]CUO39556.1 sensory box histidine kinase [Clostridium disporicum]